MDRKFLLENNLMKAHNDFMRLCNEGYISTSLEEADDQQPDPQGAPQGGPDAPGGMPPAGPDGGAPGGDMPPMDGGDPNGQAGMPPAQEAPDGGMPPMDGNDPNAPGNIPPAEPDGSAPGGDMPPMGGPEEPQEEDDVIDVEDITQAQEKLNKKENMVGQDLGKLDSRISNLLTAVEKMQGIINHNNDEITALKAELQKRVPTQTERLNMRSLDSYPFNINPDDYWKEKAKEGVYQPMEDNNQPEGKEYVIKNEDIDDYSDSDIEKSFGDPHQTLNDIFKKW